MQSWAPPERVLGPWEGYATFPKHVVVQPEEERDKEQPVVEKEPVVKRVKRKEEKGKEEEEIKDRKKPKPKPKRKRIPDSDSSEGERERVDFDDLFFDESRISYVFVSPYNGSFR